jgi:hypothetical protein
LQKPAGHVKGSAAIDLYLRRTAPTGHINKRVVGQNNCSAVDLDPEITATSPGRVHGRAGAQCDRGSWTIGHNPSNSAGTSQIDCRVRQTSSSRIGSNSNSIAGKKIYVKRQTIYVDIAGDH